MSEFSEPWIIRIDALGWQLIYTGKGNEIEGTALMPHKQRARAVACVNAMAGIPDPAAFMKAHGELVEAAKKLYERTAHTFKCGSEMSDDDDDCTCGLVEELAAFQAALAACAQQEKPV